MNTAARLPTSPLHAAHRLHFILMPAAIVALFPIVLIVMNSFKTPQGHLRRAAVACHCRQPSA